MKTYISDIIPKIQRYSKKLDNLTLLTNQHWVVLDDNNNYKKVFIFRNNGQLLISVNGRVTKGNWEILNNNSLLIDQGNESFLYKHGFFDEQILALKIDGVNEYSFLINESKFESEEYSIDKVTNLLKNTYLNSNRTIKAPTSHNKGLSKAININIPSDEYRIIKEYRGHSFSMGDYIEYTFEFGDKIGKVLFNSEYGHFCYSTYDQVLTFNDLNECILSYIMYVNSK